jgi:endoglucanase Acf2
MFTVDTVVDQSVKTAKQFTSYIQDKDVQKNVNSLVDAQADFAKSVYNTSLDLSKQVVEQFKNFDPKAFTFSK